MSDPQRYWMYLSAPAGGIAQMIADDKGDWVNHRDYVKLQAENERLRKAGDAMCRYVGKEPKHSIQMDRHDKSKKDWNKAKEGRNAK